MFLPTTRISHPFRIRRRLIIELICESFKIYAFRNQESTCWTAYRCFIFASIQTLQCSVASPYHVILKIACFQKNMWAEATLVEFEHGYPHSNALLQFCFKFERWKLHRLTHHPTKCEVINNVKLFLTAEYTVTNL